MHRRQHLDVAHRVEAEPPGNPLLDDLHHLAGAVFRGVGGHEIEVGFAMLRRIEVRQSSSVDGMRARHDPACRRLTENLGESVNGAGRPGRRRRR